MEAEWHALLAALMYVASIDVDNREESFIYSDSQTVVKQATGEWKVKHENIIPLYTAFLSLKRSNMHIAWIPRQLVYLADKEAQKGHDNEMPV
jgi:ribonuclease HI